MLNQTQKMSEEPQDTNIQPAGILPGKYPDLHTSEEVQLAVAQHDARNDALPNDPKAMVGAYLGSVMGRHGLMGGNAKRRDAQIAHRVIKPEDIPEGYYENQRRIARELGHGDIQITEGMKRQLGEAVVADQTKSLETWVDYVNHPDASYPAWFRYFTVRSVLKLSDYDKEKQVFKTRSAGTAAPFPDLNREALAYVYDAMQQKLDGKDNDDDTVRKLVEGANFGKLYAHAVREVTPASPENRENTNGEWTKYDQTDDPERALELAKSLQGHGTGWCTAGESTAQMQLQGGDFYVFYSYDEEDKATVPRIAIRMERGQVAEVRGINTRQELEPVMIEKVEAQLAELPGGEAYKQKAADMKRVTRLEAEAKAGHEFSQDDLMFIYEAERHIYGFGYGKDPRVLEIIASRNAVEDILNIYGARPELPNADSMLSIARNSRRIENIYTRMENNEDIDEADLEFLYCADAVSAELVYPNIRSFEDVVRWRHEKGKMGDDFLKMAETMELSEDKWKQVQAGGLRLLASVANAKRDGVTPSPEALSLLYEDEGNLRDALHGSIGGIILDLRKERHYGADYTAMQVSQQDLIDDMHEKMEAGSELDIRDLKFIYEIDTPMAHISQSYIAGVILKRDVAADIETILKTEPKYEVFGDELRESAAATVRLLSLYKDFQAGKVLSKEDVAYVDKHQGYRSKAFIAARSGAIDYSGIYRQQDQPKYPSSK